MSQDEQCHLSITQLLFKLQTSPPEFLVFIKSKFQYCKHLRMQSLPQAASLLQHMISELPHDQEISEQELHVADMVVRLLGAKEVMVHPAVATQLVDSLLQLASRLQRAELADSNSAPPVAEAVLQELQAALLSPPTPSQQQQSAQHQQELHRLTERLGFQPAELCAAQAGLAWQTAAALHSSRACALAGCSGAASSSAACGERSERRNGGNSLQAAPAAAASAMDVLLCLAADMPRALPGCGQLSSLQGFVVGGLLPLMRQVPLHQQQLSAQGWQSYFLLEPQALQQCLAEILQARTLGACPAGTGAVGRTVAEAGAGGSTATAGGVNPAGVGAGALLPCLAALSQIIRQQPHWQAAADAVAAQPALHLLARRTLISWLAESGSLAAWELLVWLLQHITAAAEGSSRPTTDGWRLLQGSSGVQQAQQPSVQEQRRRQHQRQPVTQAKTLGVLPLPLRVLYTAGPARQLAALLHAAPPSLPGLAQAASLLQQQQQRNASQWSGPAAAALGTASLPVGAQSSDCSEGAVAGGAAVVAQQLWEALLDQPAWLSLALQQLPLQEASAAAAAAAAAPASEPTALAGSGQGPCDASPQGRSCDGGGPVAQQESQEAAEAQRAAAVFVGWVMWPHDWRRRELLQEALLPRLQEGENSDGGSGERRVGMRAVLPWLQTLLKWQRHWAAGAAV